MFLSSSFDFTILTPIVILIAISALIPIVLSALKIKFVPFSGAEKKSIGIPLAHSKSELLLSRG